MVRPGRKGRVRQEASRSSSPRAYERGQTTQFRKPHVNYIFKPAIQVFGLIMSLRPERSRSRGTATMETGNISKPVAPAAPAPARVDYLVAAGAVKTDLAPEAAVQQVESSPAVRFAPSEGADFHASLEASLREVVERNVTIDPRTRELVFQTISKETGEVVRQIPDEAILRLRAYVREMQEAEEKGRAGSDVPRVEKVA